MVGVPGSGKSTTAAALAEYFEVPLIHGSRIVMDACPGDWIKAGNMAPEPCATEAIEDELSEHDEWVLDGFPRSERQLRSPHVRREAIVYLDISERGALKRAVKRNRAPIEIEQHRIKEQRRLLVPIKALCAVVIPVTFRSPDQVTDAVIRWYEGNVHPSELGSNAR